MGNFITGNTALPIFVDATPPQGLPGEFDAAHVNAIWGALDDVRVGVYSRAIFAKDPPYGAKGDGTTNDTTALQAAFSTATPGGTVVIPPGTYSITAGLAISANYVRVLAHGAKLVQSGVLQRGITITGVGVTIEGLWLYNTNGNTEWADAPAGSTNAIGIFVGTGGDGAKIQGCKVEQFGYAQIRVYQSKNVTIDGNELIGIGATKPLTAGANNNMGIEGYLSGSLSRGLTVTNNHIHDCAQGILTSFDWQDVVIVGNTIRDIQGQHGMYLDNAVNLVVAGNSVKTCGQNGIKVQISANATVDCENVTITGNAVDATSAAGIIVLPAQAALTPRFRNINIVGNTVRNPGAVGISIDHAENWIVAQNVISGCGTFGISTGTENKTGRIAGNQILNTQQTAIYLQATSTAFVTSVDGNTIDSPGLSATGTTDLRAVIYMGSGRWIVGGNIFLNTSSTSSHINSLAAATHTLRRNVDPGTRNNSTTGTVTAEGFTTNTVGSNGATVAPNMSTTRHLYETVPFATWTVGAPTNIESEAELTITVSNTSGGAITTTWNAAYHLAGAWVDPATGFQRSVRFRRNGFTFYEIGRTAADVAN